MTTLTTLGLHKILENKYYRLYMKIINSRLASQPSTGYCEVHHIIPRSMDGSDDICNLVKLTSREHFICHLLLTKFTQGQHRHSMLHAINCMRMSSNTQDDRYFNSRLYEYIKGDFSDMCKEAMTLRWQEPEFREMMIEQNKLVRLRPGYTDSLSTAQKQIWLNSDRRQNHIEYLLEHSPFNQKAVHDKCMITRAINGTNPFVSNNPMHSPELVAKKVAKTSGNNHFMKIKKSYVNQDTGENLYFEFDPGFPWKQQSNLKGKTTRAKGVSKPRIQCTMCEKSLPSHTMSRHIKAYHENS